MRNIGHLPLARDPSAEALYNEVDLAPDDWLEHRWLWWPYRDLDVRFRTFAEISPPAG